jgi:GNAT superfamily N-acetyltransferase
MMAGGKPDMEIRSLPSDHPHALELFSLQDDFYLDFLGEDGKYYTRYTSGENLEKVWVMYAGGHPAGCIAYRKKEGLTGEVKRLFVKDEFRRRGIARQLFHCVESWGRQQGMEKLFLDTRITLEPAVSIYRNRGYRIIFQQGLYIQMEKLL